MLLLSSILAIVVAKTKRKFIIHSSQSSLVPWLWLGETIELFWAKTLFEIIGYFLASLRWKLSFHWFFFVFFHHITFLWDHWFRDRPFSEMKYKSSESGRSKTSAKKTPKLELKNISYYWHRTLVLFQRYKPFWMHHFAANFSINHNKTIICL